MTKPSHRRIGAIVLAVVLAASASATVSAVSRTAAGPSTRPASNSEAGCNAPPCDAPIAPAAAAPQAAAVAAPATTTPITDPATISPRIVYDFSSDPADSLPASFPGGTLSGNGTVELIGSGWATWNPQTNGKHVLFAFDGTYEVAFATPQEAVGVTAEPNLYDVYDITIEAFDSSDASLGTFSLPIDGFGGAAFLGLRSPVANISSIVISSPPEASGFAFSDLTYGGSPAARHVIFVHGINGNAQAVGFDGLLGRIRTTFGDDHVTAFTYFQDKAYRPDPSQPACAGVAPPILPSAPDGGIPVHLDSLDLNICDSQSDLGINAVMLGADVRQRFEETGQPVILIGNSMGVAIIRGMLSYSHDHGDNIAATMVDSVFFLEGAHDGAQELVMANQNGGRDIDAQISRALLSSTWVGLDFTRPPAGDQLTPMSPWYQWANANPARLADLPYINAFGDITIGLQSCFLFWCADFQPIVPLGDVALQTGTDDPFDTPPQGGARFLRGAAGAQNWQWQMQSQIVWDPARDEHMVGALISVLLLPQAHPNLGDHLADVRVSDCQTGQETGLDVALFRIVEGRVVGAPYSCQP